MMERRFLPWLIRLVAVLVLTTPLLADPVNLVGSGSAVFGGSPTTAGTTFTTAPNSITSTSAAGTATITYSAQAGELNFSLNVGAPAQNITLGTFNSTSTVPSGTGPSFAGAEVTLTISFSVPSDVGPKSFTGLLSGRVVQTTGGATIQWSTQSLTFDSPTAGKFVITLTNPQVTIVNAQGSPGVNRVNATIQLISAGSGVPGNVPEPGTLALAGGGLLSFVAAARRRKRG